MPSGKKARGRKNRAKKEATRTADLRTLWEPTVLRRCVNNGVNTGANNGASNASSCEHMLAVFPRIPQEGPAVSFMNHIAGKGFFDWTTPFQGDPLEFCFQQLSHFQRVQEEASERSLAINLLLRFLRNVFIKCSMIGGESWFQQHTLNEVAVCIMINILELIGTYSDGIVARRRVDKTGNRLVGGNRRDAVKFVAKRLPCTYLKKLHRAARKKVAKMGTCHGCLKQFPRSQLYVCTGCMMVEYCSRGCQRADRSCHKQICGHPELMSRDLPADYVVKTNPQGR